MDDDRLEAEGELSMALLALDDGELKHAAEHVAAALMHAPTLPEAHELLARLSDPELFPVGEPAFLGTVVARAHVMAARGDYAQALDLLLNAQRYAPDGHWAHVPWVLDPALPGHLEPDALAPMFAGLAEFGAPPDALAPWVQLVRHSAQAHPAHPLLLWLGSRVLRRADEPEDAAALAERSFELEPTTHAAVAVGSAYRQLGRYDEAEKAMMRGLDLDPRDTYLQTDLAELFRAAGRLEEGLVWVERVLRREPEHEAAFPTACGMRFERDGDVRHLVALADYLAINPDNGHGHRVLADCSSTKPWLGQPADATEAVVNVMYQVLGKKIEEAAGGSVRVSAPEPPSAILAFGRALPDMAVTIEEVPSPDPRVPLQPVTYQVWRYEGMTALPAVPAPSAAGLQAVAELATEQWPHLPAAFVAATELGRLPLDDLLGVLAHPPALPYERLEQWPQWVRQVQAWACLGIVHHRAGQTWRRSQRREVLIDLAFGPEDWVSEAALLAMVAAAWVKQEIRRDVADLVGRRLAAAAKAAETRPVTVLDSLRDLALVTPGMSAQVPKVAGAPATGLRGLLARFRG